MITTSIYTSLQNNPFFSNAPSEFRIIPLSQSLKHLLNAQNEAARKFFVTRDLMDKQTLSLLTNQFNEAVDSLLQMTERKDIRLMIGETIQMHKGYDSFLDGKIALIVNHPAYDALTELQNKQSLVDSIHQQIRTVNDAYSSSLSKVLKIFEQQRANAFWDTFIMIGLSLAVIMILGWFLARALTKPFRALKAGTEKVGEGKYETVPIISNDEVADLTRAFNLMSDKLKQLDEMRMQLMSEISHEMRTPLQVIKAGCYSIVHTKDGPALTERQRDAVGMISHATNRINNFVNSFLDVAKMEAGLMKFRFEETNLVELLTPLVQEAQLIAQTRQITLEFTSEEIPLISLDKERMSQVCSNLLSNALKYTPNDGRISIRVTKLTDCMGVNKNNRGCVKIEVQDSGVGIPDADLKKLFNKFYQAQNTPLVNEKGSGLGLALVKHVAEAHGGQVSVQSQVGVGSTFSVLIPA